MQVDILKGGFVPTRATSESAGYDLFAPVNGRVKSKDRLMIDLKFRLYLKPGTYGQIYGRSGLALRNGIAVLGGVIDSDYRGEVKVILLNTGAEHFDFKRGDRIAQLVVHQIVLDTPKVAALFPDEVDNSVYIPKLLQDDPEDTGVVYAVPGSVAVEPEVASEPPPAEFYDPTPATPASTPEPCANVVDLTDHVEQLLSTIPVLDEQAAPADLNNVEETPEVTTAPADPVSPTEVLTESAIKKPRAPAKKRGKGGFGSTGN